MSGPNWPTGGVGGGGGTMVPPSGAVVREFGVAGVKPSVVLTATACRIWPASLTMWPERSLNCSAVASSAGDGRTEGQKIAANTVMLACSALYCITAGLAEAMAPGVCDAFAAAACNPWLGDGLVGRGGPCVGPPATPGGGGGTIDMLFMPGVHTAWVPKAVVKAEAIEYSKECLGARHGKRKETESSRESLGTRHSTKPKTRKAD